MGIKFRLGAQRNADHQAISNLGAALRRVAEIRLPTLQDKISVDMFASNSLPYEALKTYRTIKVEFDCRRAHTQAIAQRALSRGL